MIAAKDLPIFLDRRRDEFAWRIVHDGVLPDQRILAVGVIADEFVERLLVALDAATYLDVIMWVDRICGAYVEFPQIGSMLACACRSVVAQLGGVQAVAPDLVMELNALEQSIAAVAFKPRLLRTKIEPQLDEVDILLHGFIEQLEAIDPLSAEHSHAVAAWCARIGRRLSLSDSEVMYLSRCGLVHDIGKMRISAQILQAPRTLTAAEWEVMRRHSLYGEEIVNELRPLRDFAPPVRSHHERLDGRGYPDGLVGSEISLATRIVTVADAFNAMIGRRPYRLPISPESALERLVDDRSRQFDPIIVEAMISVVRCS